MRLCECDWHVCARVFVPHLVHPHTTLVPNHPRSASSQIDFANVVDEDETQARESFISDVRCLASVHVCL